MRLTRKSKYLVSGVTLIELVLVLVIIASAFTMYTKYVVQKGENVRIDRTLLQIQQILNAASAYYIANGTWPGSECTQVTLNSGTASLMQPIFLPDLAAGMVTPWGTAAGATGYYKTHFCSRVSLLPAGVFQARVAGVPRNAFVVETEIGSSSQRMAIGKILAGRLPGSIFAAPTLFSWITIPPQSLNKLGSIKFGGLYHHGACIPTPVCPTVAGSGVAATAQLFLVPTSISGVNDNASTNVYPISSFTAYASGPAEAPVATPAAPAACIGSANPPTCDPATGTATGLFWRACVQIVTERGDVSVTRTDSNAVNYWGQNVTIAAFTRCTPNNEKSGSGFDIYGD